MDLPNLEEMQQQQFGPDGPVKGGDGGDGITVTIPGSPLAVAGGGGGAGAHGLALGSRIFWSGWIRWWWS